MATYSDVENDHPNLNTSKDVKVSFFEVERTPPDVHRQREKVAEMAARSEVSILMLTPFTASPKIEFEKVKLGKSGVRNLVVRNPGDKPLDVVFDRLPKPEKGFCIEYDSFRLGGREETSLLIGWTPVKAVCARESFIVKFGKFSAQVILIGSCISPEDKQFKSIRAPPRPLGPKNTNLSSNIRVKNSRPSVTTTKLSGSSSGQTKISIPLNPVVRKTTTPPKRLIDGQTAIFSVHTESTLDISLTTSSVSVLGVAPIRSSISTSSSVTNISKDTKHVEFVCGTKFQPGELPATDLRRETFMRERPLPSGGDVVESTPIVSSRTETFRDIRRDTIVVSQGKLDFESGVGLMLPPTDVRRQTFIPNQREEVQDIRRETFIPARFCQEESWTPQKPIRNNWEPDMNRTHEVATPEVSRVAPNIDKPLDLAVAPLNLSRSCPEKGLSDLLAQYISNEEPINLSLTSRVDQEEIIDKDTSPVPIKPLCLYSTDIPVTPKRYMPQVSDISIPTPNLTPARTEQGNLSLMKDPRLFHILESVKGDGNNLDLSVGSHFGDCSMAVNLASPARERERDLEEELASIEENKRSFDEEELERIAQARATSTNGELERALSELQMEDNKNISRLSSGTIVINPGPSIPDIPAFESFLVETIETECRVVRKEEIKTSEVFEEVIEYEYEIINGERRLVGETYLGQTAACHNDTVTRTPVRYVKHSLEVVADQMQDDQDLQMFEIEAKLCPADPKMRPRSIDLTDDDVNSKIPIKSAQVFNISVHQSVNLDQLVITQQDDQLVITQQDDPTTPKASDKNSCQPKYPPLVSDQEQVVILPGLKGSPRISNQVSSTVDSFLQTTINETSFIPPSPDDPRRCSTGVKDKEKATPISPCPEVRKTLFSNSEDKPVTNNHTIEFLDGPLQPTLNSDFVPISSTGFELPVISSPSGSEAGGGRLSSDTYIAAGDGNGPLSIIHEETNEKTNGTFDKDLFSVKDNETQNMIFEICANDNETIADKSAPLIDNKTVLRTPVRPKRSKISYTRKDIVNIGKPASGVTEDLETDLVRGVMSLQVSPGVGAEKRRKTGGSKIGETSKRTRLVSRPPVKPVVSIRANKNPPPPKPAAKRMSITGTTKSSQKITSSKDKSAGVAKSRSVPARVSLSRGSVGLPTRRLQMARPAGKGVVHHPNPFAARNTYYDERWIDKQERGFTKWLNFVLTPQVDISDNLLPGKVDVAKLWSQCSKDVKIPRAPTREVMSMRAYTAKREMNRLRRVACKLWQSREVAVVVAKVEYEIEKLRLVIRQDRNITKDVGMKQTLLQMILSYNPLWLRIGLETIFGELLPVSDNSDLLGISRFLVHRLLSNPDILAEFAHPTVPHSFRDGHQDALHRFALKKFLELVFFLDKAKGSRFIHHNPCLFCPDSPHKSSREILLSFSAGYLAGEGDVTKHLAYMGYIVSHKQTKLDEFDYAVTNIKTDLRCGLRLSKVSELLNGVVLDSNLRVPAVSRLQKVHNTDLALTAFKQGGVQVDPIVSKDMVDGNREKTLQLLWNIIFSCQLSQILDLDKLRDEIIHLKRSLSVRTRLGDSNATSGDQWLKELSSRSPASRVTSDLVGDQMSLLMQWSQLVCAHYNVPVENWTTSWCDGRGLCLLLHHYQPSLVDRSQISDQTSLTNQQDNLNLDDSLDFNYGAKQTNSTDYDQFFANEKSNYKLLISKVTELGGVPVLISPGDMSNTIPDQKITVTFIGYLAARLLDLSREIKAARTIQLAYRRWTAIRNEENMKVKFGQ